MVSMTNLIETWLAAWFEQNPNSTKTEAVRDLNAHCGGSVDLSRLGQWLRGDRHPNPAQVRYMARFSASHAIEEALGVQSTNKQAGRLAEMLTPPEKSI